MKKKLLAVAAAVAVTGAGYLVLSPPSVVSDIRMIARHGPLATALVAHDLCYGVLLQGRSEEDVRAAELGPRMDPLLSWVGADVDRERGEVRTGVYTLFDEVAGMRADGSCSLGVRGKGHAPPPELADPSPDPEPWPEGDAIDPEARQLVPDYEALEEAVEAEFRPTESGVDRGTRSVLVVHRGRLVYERHAEGWDRMIPQNGRSNSKAVVAALVGVVAADGGLSLDDAGLRPEWRDDERADIRLEDLLQMESGLDWRQAYDGTGDTGELLFLAPNAADYAAAKPLRHSPGERFNYSEGDTKLLVSIARSASGLSDEEWAEFPYEALFEPVGIEHAVLGRDPSGEFIGVMHAAAVDWARFGLFLARDGVWNGERILPEGWVDFMTTPTETSGCRYGAQLWIRGGCDDGEPAEVFELSGFMGQNVTVVPETETVIVRTGFGPWIMRDLLERIFPALGMDAPTRMASAE